MDNFLFAFNPDSEPATPLPPPGTPRHAERPAPATPLPPAPGTPSLNSLLQRRPLFFSCLVLTKSQTQTRQPHSVSSFAGAEVGEDGSVCPVCHEPKKGKKRYCDKHHKAFECIQTSATKPKPGTELKVKKKQKKKQDRAKKKKAAKKGDKVSSDGPSSSDLRSDEITVEHKAFNKVFGFKRHKGEPMLQQQVLLKFCDDFPEGSAPKGKKRGDGFTVTNFVHDQGTRVSKKQVSSKAKWDYEFFCKQMSALRGWPATKAHEKWTELDTPENFADNLGEAPFRKRLRIPPNLSGGDRSDSENENFELKAMRTEGNKATKNMKDDDKAQLLSEMRTGFSGVEQPGSAL